MDFGPKNPSLALLIAVQVDSAAESGFTLKQGHFLGRSEVARPRKSKRLIISELARRIRS